MKKLLLIGGIVVVCLCLALVGAVALSGGGNQAKPDTTAKSSDQGSQQTPTKTEPTAKPSPTVQKLPGINEPAQSKNFRFTVLKAQNAQTLGTYSKKTAQGVYLMLTTKIENTSKESQILNSWDFNVFDGEGRKYDLSSEGNIAYGVSEDPPGFFMNVKVEPGLSKTVMLIFDVVPDAKGLQLQVQDNKRIALE